MADNMSGWQWFWTLVGFIVYIIVLIFLYFFKPFEDLFVTVINGISYDNAIFWAVLIIAIVGFCAYPGALTGCISCSRTASRAW